MSSEPPTKKVKTSTDAAPPAVFGRGVHFTPELIARMATYADANNSPDVMNICLAVGPDVSRTIKHFYLRRNEKYLICTLLSLCGIRRRKQFDVEAPRREKAGTNHRAWMEVNTDWKATAVRNERISTMRQTRSLTNMIPFGAFNSATIAAELGLLEVLKFLVEDKGVSPNEYGWTFCRGSIYRGRHTSCPVHLLSVAMAFRREDIFQYLLSLPSTNLYCEIDQCSEGEARYGLFEQALDIYVICNGAEAYLTSFVNRNLFDLNRACQMYSAFSGSRSHCTCLFIALYELTHCLDDFDEYYGSENNGPWSCPLCTFNSTVDIRSRNTCGTCDTPRPAKHSLSRNLEDQFTDCDYDRLNRYVDVIKFLLEAGANPTHPVLDAGVNVFDFIKRRLHEVRNIGDPFIRLVKSDFIDRRSRS